MIPCVKCGLPLRADEHLLCFECDPSIQEGCTVQQEFSSNRGIAYMCNSKGQWMVKWNDGRVDIVHQSNLKKVQC